MPPSSTTPDARRQARRIKRRRPAILTVLGAVLALTVLAAAALAEPGESTPRPESRLTRATREGRAPAKDTADTTLEPAPEPALGPGAPPATSVPATSLTAEPPSTTPPAPLPAAIGIATVTAEDLGASWHEGCPVGPDQLRAVTVRHVDFDGTERTGTLIVHADVAQQVADVFAQLYAERFPLHSIIPVSAFGASDDASMDADNTSAFNCRPAVAAGPPQWSMHAYGTAIDVNPRENPYLFQGRTWPSAGAPFADRAQVRPGMATAGDVLVAAFAQVGWGWGGDWSDPDYQHFSATGH